MSRSQIDEVVALSTTGVGITGARVTITRRDGTTPTVWQDDISNSVINQPLISVNGQITGWLDDGSYRLIIDPPPGGPTFTPQTIFVEIVNGDDHVAFASGGGGTQVNGIADVPGLQPALNLKQAISEKGQPSGYAPLGTDNKVPGVNLPAETDPVASAALTAHGGAANPHNQYQLRSEEGQPNGYAGLDGAGKVPGAQIPAETDPVASAALTAHGGAANPHAQYQLRSEEGQANGYAGLDAASLLPSALLPNNIIGVIDVTKSPYNVLPGLPANQSAGINQAITDANAAAIAGSGSVEVRLPAGVIVAHNILMKSWVKLQGAGWATEIRTPDAQAGGVSIRYDDVAVVRESIVRDLYINGNRTTGASGAGIDTANGNAYIGDTLNLIDHVKVRDTGGDGIRLAGGTNSRMTFLTNFVISIAGGHGLVVAGTDNHVHSGMIGGSQGHGVYISSGGDSLFTGVRSFFSGYARGASTPNQDRSGFRIDAGVQRVSIFSSHTQDNGYCSVECYGDENVIQVACGGENQRQNLTTAALVKVGGVRNTITVQSKSADLTSINTPFVAFDGATAQFNEVKVNGLDTIGTTVRVLKLNSGSAFSNVFTYNGGTDQIRQIAVGATSASLAPLTYLSPIAGLTANITFNHVAAIAHEGARCKISILQDAVGGRTVTLPANVKLRNGFAIDTVAGRLTSFELIFDGTNWVQTGSANGSAVGSLNVKDYGALGNGTDDTAAINATIAALGTQGGEVFFPAGVYLVSSTITVPGGVVFKGTSIDYSVVTANAARGSIIRSTAAVTGPVVQLGSDNTSTASGMTGASIEKMVVDGVGTAQSAIRTYGRRNYVRWCQAWRGSAYAIDMQGQNGYILDSVAGQNSVGSVIRISNIDNKVMRNQIREGGSDQILVDGSGPFEICDNHMYGITATGSNRHDIRIINAVSTTGGDYRIVNNTIEGTPGHHILWVVATGTTVGRLLISSNTFYNLGNSVGDLAYDVVCLDLQAATTILRQVVMIGNTFTAPGGSNYRSVLNRLGTGTLEQVAFVGNQGQGAAKLDNNIPAASLQAQGNSTRYYNGTTTNILRTDNHGLATFSGTGAQTAFVIPHGLAAAPTDVTLTAGSAAAAAAFYWTADATNITVTFTTAPASGTNNVLLSWVARI